MGQYVAVETFASRARLITAYGNFLNAHFRISFAAPSRISFDALSFAAPFQKFSPRPLHFICSALCQSSSDTRPSPSPPLMEENTGPTKGPETSSKDAASLAVSQGPRPNATHLSFEDDNHLLKPKTASSQGAETLNRDTASPAMSQGPRPNATNLSFKDENHQLLKPEYSKNSGGRVRRKRSTLGSIRTQASSTGKRSLRGFFNDLDFSKGRDLDLSKGWDHFVANLPGTSKKNRKKVGGNRKKVDELTFKDPNSTPATTFPPPPTGLPLKSQQPATAFPPLHSETSFDVQQSATTSAPSPTGSPPDPQPPVRDTQPPPGDQLLQGEDQGGHHVETGLVDEEVEMLLNDDDGDGDEEKESLLAEDDDDGERDINDALWLSNLSRFFWSRLHVVSTCYTILSSR